MAVPAESDATDRILGGRYRIESAIGRGGMSTVYRARDESLGRAVAVKVFHAASVDVARQEAELAVLAGLDHHGLVSLIDAGVDDGDRYMVMALVNGSNLGERLRVGPVAARHIAEIGYDLAEALDYVHGHGVIHRDIKPSNVLLVDYGDGAPRARARLTDFGVALADDVERMTADGHTTGTAAYLSPEQAAGGRVTAASDVYSLGLVLLECFTRRVEYPGTIAESAVARLSRSPVIPDTLPGHWRSLLAAMTASDPQDRPTRRELVSTLRQVVIAESARHKDPDVSVFDVESDPAAAAAPNSELLDTLPHETLHRATAMAARLFAAPISIVSVVDEDRTWFASHYGPRVEEIASQVDLSRAAIPQDSPVIVEDAATDPRAQENPLVTGPLGIRFYVGVPLKRHDGHTMGTLSVLDFIPGSATEGEIANLEDLSALIVAQLELRQEGRRQGGDTQA